MMECPQCNNIMSVGKKWWINEGTLIKDLSNNIVIDNSNEFPGHEIDEDEAQVSINVEYCSTCSVYIEVEDA